MKEGDYFWLIILGLMLGYELWAEFGGHQTMSMSVWRVITKRRWFRWVVIGALAALTWHFVARSFKTATTTPTTIEETADDQLRHDC